jgi:hypothetical protein
MAILTEAGQRRAMLYFTVAYLIAFTIVAVAHENYEFLYYTAIMSVLIFIVVLYHKHLSMTTSIMFGLTLAGALHIFGGNIHVHGIRLYDYWFIAGWFRYDNLVHLISSFTAALIAFNLLDPHLSHSIKQNRILIGVIIVLIACGMGAINEIFELAAVLYFHASAQVGGYLNNAFDLVWNLIGSTAAAFFISWRARKALHSDQ